MGAALPGPVSHHYESRRLRLHYVDWGNPEAPPLLLLHGGRDHCRSWDWVAAKLRDDWHIIAPDLRGHGDSAWSPDGNYTAAAFLYDLSELIHQHVAKPVTIIAHSFGANVALRYAGLYPAHVRKLIAIEGAFTPGAFIGEPVAKGVAGRLRNWIDFDRKLSDGQPRRYQSIAEACRRMQDENKKLNDTQARHLTTHGVNQNEDGSFSWKFDPYVRSRSPHDAKAAELDELWHAISCPVLHVYGSESWMPNPLTTGRMSIFQAARLALFEHAGHWVHHDQLEPFMAAVKTFLDEAVA
jgi:pimeloyl-ACP methyl ester carboxylesterase